MNLSIKQRLLALTILPILLISIAMFWLSYNQSITLNAQQTKLAHSEMMEMKKSELAAYLDLALSALEPLNKRNASKKEAIETLKALKYGDSGYFFGYDSKGIRLFLGSSNKGIGDNFWDSRDTQDNLYIQDLINEAKSKSKKFTTYFFPRPGSSESLPKLGYSIYLPKWDIIIGSGFYTDDIDAVVTSMDKQSNEELNKGILHSILLCLLIAALVYLFSYFINRSIMRPLNLFSGSIARFAQGNADLTARMETFSIPEYKKLGRDFNAFVANLHDMISLVQKVAAHVGHETISNV